MQPKTEPKIEAKPETKPRAKAKPKPEAKPKAEAKPKSQAKADAKPKAEAKPAHGDAKAHPHPDKPTGGSKIDNDFLKGISGVSSPGTDKIAAADKPAGVSSASLVSAVAHQIKPHWSAPQGVDTEKLVTVLAWNLKPDGSLDGRPTLVSQSGITDANRAQAQRHVEMAMRAVELAAPFNLPPAAFSQWHHVAAFRFDRKLSQ